MPDVTRTVRYEGDPARCGWLAQMLREEGVRVEYTPPEEKRGYVVDDINQVVVNLICTGTGAAILAGVQRFKKHHPRHKVDIESDDGTGPDDGGFLPGGGR
jgi:hypothetical protein